MTSKVNKVLFGSCLTADSLDLTCCDVNSCNQGLSAMCSVPVKTRRLGKAGLILVTHGHFDHVADVSELAALTGAKVVANAELVEQMAAMCG